MTEGITFRLPLSDILDEWLERQNSSLMWTDLILVPHRDYDEIDVVCQNWSDIGTVGDPIETVWGYIVEENEEV